MNKETDDDAIEYAKQHHQQHVQLMKIDNCFVCNTSFENDKNNELNLFRDRTPINDLAPSFILSQILNRPLGIETVHSDSLCQNCFKLCLEFEEMEQRLVEIRLEFIRNFNNTALTYDLEPVELEDDEVEDDNVDDDNLVEEDDGCDDGEDGKHQIHISGNRGEEELQIEASRLEQLPEHHQEILAQYELATANESNKHEPRVILLENIQTPNLLQEGENTAFSIDASHFREEYLSEENGQNMVEVVAETEDYVDLIVHDHDNQMSMHDENSYESGIVKDNSKSSENSQDSNRNHLFTIKVEQSEDNNSQSEFSVPQNKAKNRKSTKTADKEAIVLRTEEMFKRDGESYICQLCSDKNLIIYDGRTIGIHLKSIHDIKIYLCDICGQDFRKRSELTEHLDEHVSATEDGFFTCDLCNRDFNNLRLFRIHKRIHYSNTKTWPCTKCNKKYSSKNLLDEHMNMHTGKRPYKCAHCEKDFASKYTLSAHMKIHSDRPRPFECRTCGKSFYSGQNLIQHEKTHTGLRPHVCEECDKSFSTQHNLEVHKIVHTGFKPFICRTCGKAFARRAEIKDHERTHTGEKPFKCDLCEASFAQRSNLQSHKRATHLDDKRYQCDICDRRFKRRRLLDYHKKATHTGERPFQCRLCSATFVYPEHFKKHLRIHTGLKPYSCEICKKMFNSRDNRNAHRFVHSDKKPYECTICGAGFMRKPLLFGHMKQAGHYSDAIIINQPRIQSLTTTTNPKDGSNEVVFKTEQVVVDKDNSSDAFTVEYIEDGDHIDGEEIIDDDNQIQLMESEMETIIPDEEEEDEEDDDDHNMSEDHNIIGEELSVDEILENSNFATENIQPGAEIFITEEGQLYETSHGTLHYVKIINDPKAMNHSKNLTIKLE